MHSILTSKNLPPQEQSQMADDVVGFANGAVSTTGKPTDLREESKPSPITEVKEKPVDFRYVAHGDGPCSCCGPWTE